MLYYIDIYFFLLRRILLDKNYTIKKVISVIMLMVLSFCINYIPTPYKVICFILIPILSGITGYLCSRADIIKITITSLILMMGSLCIKSPDIKSVYESLEMFVLMYPFSVFAGISIKKKSDFRTIYTYSVLIFILGIMLIMLKMSVVDKINIMDTYIREPLRLMMDSNLMFGQLASSMGNQSLTPEYINIIADSIAYSTPAVMIIATMIIMIVYIYILKRIVKFINKDEKFENIISFSRLKLKRTTVLVLFVMYLISLFASGMFGIITGNIISILTVMCTGCGLSLIDFYFRKYIRSSILRIIIYITFFTFVSFVFALFTFINPLTILSLLGMIDASRDFRKIDNFNIRILFK